MSYPQNNAHYDGPILKKHKRSNVTFASALLSQRLSAMTSGSQGSDIPAQDKTSLEDDFDYLSFHGMDKSEWVRVSDQEDNGDINWPYDEDVEEVIQEQEEDIFSSTNGK